MRILCTLVFSACALTATAGGFTDISGKAIDDYGFAIRGRAWMTDQDSAVQDSTRTQPGTVIDFDDDLDFDGDPLIPELDLEFRTEELALHAMAWYSAEGDNTTSREDEGFDGRIILAGDALSARFRVVQAAVHFEWVFLDFGSSKTFGLEVGVIVGARWTRFDADIRPTATHERLHSGAQAVLPDLGLTLCVGFLNIFEIEAYASGMVLDVSTYDYESINGGAELRIYIDKNFYVGGGYRFSSGSLERGDSEEDGRLLEYEYHGPMVTLGIQF
ncbi:MAG: hypothetical protein HYY18_07890 [Planctomycetes bacterium]|nr:hypothetical protein [Planctomycetota bacterium]